MRWVVWALGWMGCADKPGDSGTSTTAEVSEDADGDGYSVAYDCNDQDPSIYPAAEETWYDGVDSDCSGGSDYDQDGDGEDRSPEGADCDDLDAAVYTAADERCDEIDNDCDGAVDEDAVDALPTYPDDDGDGYGRGEPIGAACEAEPGEATAGGDCNDGSATVNPGAVETCNGVDDDCDTFVDDNPTDGLRFYADTDGDGHGDPYALAVSCTEPDGYVADAADCDDTDALSYPGAPELCDLRDNDCDGTVDDNATDPRTYYRDADSDGFGVDADTAAACGAPTGYTERAGDCDDATSAINPGVEETCNGLDDNCNGEVDSDATAAVAYHPDDDGDGYGDSATTVRACTPVDGWLTDGADCDDADAAVSPAATEACDGLDNDCDGTVDPSGSAGSTTWFLDADSDGYGDAAVTTLACTAPAGYAATGDDCDDRVAAANPGNRESCDGLDNNCDGAVDEATAVDATIWYADADRDGYGDPASTANGCTVPSGYTADGDDCDDTDADVNPAAPESDDGVDQDCDVLVDEDFVAAGDIIITEVARQPYTGGSGTSTHADAQWFELYNTSARSVDLSGWYFEEQDLDNFYVSPDAGLVIAPGAYVVLCYADTWFASPSVCAYTWGDAAWGAPYYDNTFYFDRDEDLLSVWVEGAGMDDVHWYYDATNGYWPRVARYSMEFDEAASQDATTNDDVGEWCQAAASVYSDGSYAGAPDYGTPAAANGACP